MHFHVSWWEGILIPEFKDPTNIERHPLKSPSNHALLQCGESLTKAPLIFVVSVAFRLQGPRPLENKPDGTSESPG